MKTFDFSLQQVLDLRVHERKLAERTFAAARQRRRTLEDRIQRLRKHFEQRVQSQRYAQTDLRDFRRRAAHGRTTRQKQRTLTQELDEAKARENDARNQLLEKQRAEETLQSLYEDEHDAHIDRQLQANQQLHDEQAISQHLRQNPLRS